MKKNFLTVFVLFWFFASYSQDLKPVKIQTMSGLRCGYENSKGVRVIPAKYFSASEFKDGFAIVSDENGYMTYINSLGKELTQKKYKNLRPFIGNRAIIGNDVYLGFGTWLIIDKTGKVIVPEGKYKRIGDFKNGYAVVGTPDSYSPDYCSLWGVIDINGKEIISPTESYDTYEFIEKNIVAKDGNINYLFNLSGKLIYPYCPYPIVPTGNGNNYFVVEHSRLVNGVDHYYYGVIDYKGNVFLKNIFKKITDFDFNNNTLAKVFFDENTFFYVDKDFKCVEFDNVKCPEK